MNRDRYEPKLRVRASGYSGSGYKIPTRLGADGKPLLVPGVTTVLGALDKGGAVQWAVDQTAAFCVANIDALLNRTEEQGFYFARYYHKRKPDFDNPEVDIHNYHSGVLDDLAELGTLTHDWLSDHIVGYFEPDLTRPEQVEMAGAFLAWEVDHDIEVVATEVTVVGEGWAGTLDHIWIVDGIPTLVDAKTSRAIRRTHLAQLAALGSATGMMTEVGPGEGVEYETKKWGKTYWREDPVPPFSQYAVLHLRPGDVDNRTGEYIEPFCHFEVIDQAKIDAAYGLFTGALSARLAERDLKMLEKEEDTDD